MDRVRLQIEISGKVMKRLEIPRAGVVIGSDPKRADLAVSDPGLAPEHVRLRDIGEGLVLVTPLSDAPPRVGTRVISTDMRVPITQRLTLTDAVDVSFVADPRKSGGKPRRKEFFPRVSVVWQIAFVAYIGAIVAIAAYFWSRGDVETFEPGSAWAREKVLTDTELASCRAAVPGSTGDAEVKVVAQAIGKALFDEEIGALQEAVREYERALASAVAPAACKPLRYAADRRAALVVIIKQMRLVQ